MLDDKTYDVSYLKVDGNNRNWVKVGTAFSDGETGRIGIKLDAYPIPEYWHDKRLTLFPKC